jgi:hypothetical protein
VPDIPTAAEAGLPEFSLANWNGMFAPKGTPKDIIGKLNAAVSSTLADASVVQKLVDLGSEIPSREQQTPEAIAALQKVEIEKWWPIIKAANVKGSDPAACESRQRPLCSPFCPRPRQMAAARGRVGRGEGGEGAATARLHSTISSARTRSSSGMSKPSASENPWA